MHSASCRQSVFVSTFALAAVCALSGATLLDGSQSAVRATGQAQSAVVRANGRASAPVLSKAFHGDSALAGTGLAAAFQAATVDLDRESCGMAQASVVWDLDMEREFRYAALTDEDLVVGMTSLDARAAIGPEAGADLLGMTRARGHSGAAWVFVVVDKLDYDPELAEWTALHELGHAFGMMHVKAGVMQPTAPFMIDGARVEWDDADRDEFCRAIDCDPLALRACPKP